MIGDSMPVTAYALTRRASLGGDQRVFRPNWGQLRSDGLFGRPRSALFEAQIPEKLGIAAPNPLRVAEIRKTLGGVLSALPVNQKSSRFGGV